METQIPYRAQRMFMSDAFKDVLERGGINKGSSCPIQRASDFTRSKF